MSERLRELCERALGGVGDRASAGFFVPGRLEVLGKHTDYAGGRSLLAALGRGVCMVGAAHPDSTVRVTDARSGESVEFELAPELQVEAGWANYPMTVARRLARDFPEARGGAEIAFASDLPPAAGMSSSSALIVATFLVLAELNGLTSTPAYRERIGAPEELAEYLAAVEAGRGYRDLAGDHGVGTHGGSEDHTAMLCARPGELVRYAFSPVRFEGAFPVPPEYTFALAASGVRAEKTGAARDRYNQASARARQVVEAWNAATGRTDPHLAAALHSSPDAGSRLRSIVLLADEERGWGHQLRDRLAHFEGESEEVIPAACDALVAGDVAGFGAQVERSRRLAETSLHNQVWETTALSLDARALGAVAASPFGAGFGGSVWALVERGRAPDFLARWREGYLARFPQHAGEADFFLSDAAGPARRLT